MPLDLRKWKISNPFDLTIQRIWKTADLLDIAVINLKEAGRSAELGDGSLYLKLQKKMTESMLTRYHAGSTRILRSNPWKPCESGSCKNHSFIPLRMKRSEVLSKETGALQVSAR